MYRPEGACSLSQVGLIGVFGPSAVTVGAPVSKRGKKRGAGQRGRNPRIAHRYLSVQEPLRSMLRWVLGFAAPSPIRIAPPTLKRAGHSSVVKGMNKGELRIGEPATWPDIGKRPPQD